MSEERITCPSCGGAGGGPMGRAGSAWDDEEYVCPRCEGAGAILVAGDVLSQRPGIVKAAVTAAEEAGGKRSSASASGRESESSSERKATG